MSFPIHSVYRSTAILREQLFPHFTLRIGRRADGTLFGLVGGWPVPLKGLPPSLPEAYLQESKALFQRLHLEWDRGAKRIIARVPLDGGMMADESEELTEASKKESLADGFKEAKDYPNALTSYQEALAIKKRALGENHLEVATLYYKLGMIYDLQEQLDQALDFHKRALTIQKAQLGHNELDTAASLHQMGRMQTALNNLDEAEEYFMQALPIRFGKLGENHEDIQKTLFGIAYVLYLKNRYTEALSYAERALRISRQLSRNGDEDTARLLTLIAAICELQNHQEMALPYFKEAFEVTEKIEQTPSQILIDRCTNLAGIYQRLSQTAEALTYRQKAVELTKALYGNAHSKVITSQCALASFYLNIKKTDEAKEQYTEALGIAVNLHKTEAHPETLIPMQGLLRTLCSKREEKSAVELAKRILQARRTLYGENSLEVALGYNSLFYAHECGSIRNETVAAYHSARDLYDQSISGRGGLDFVKKRDPGFIEALDAIENEIRLYEKLNESDKEKVCRQLFYLSELQSLFDFDLALKTLNKTLTFSRSNGLKDWEERIARHMRMITQAKAADFSGPDGSSIGGPDYSKRKPSTFATSEEHQADFHERYTVPLSGRDPTVVCDVCTIL